MKPESCVSCADAGCNCITKAVTDILAYPMTVHVTALDTVQYDVSGVSMNCRGQSPAGYTVKLPGLPFAPVIVQAGRDANGGGAISVQAGDDNGMFKALNRLDGVSFNLNTIIQHTIAGCAITAIQLDAKPSSCGSSSCSDPGCSCISTTTSSAAQPITVIMQLSYTESYSIAAVAVNCIGVSQSSSMVPIPALNPPEAPVLMSTFRDYTGNTLVVTFRHYPASDGGCAVNKYIVTAKPASCGSNECNSNGCTTCLQSTALTDAEAVIFAGPALVPSTKYTVSVVAFNCFAHSTPSNSEVVYGVPSAPTIDGAMRDAATGQEIRVSITPPVEDGKRLF